MKLLLTQDYFFEFKLLKENKSVRSGYDKGDPQNKGYTSIDVRAIFV